MSSTQVGPLGDEECNEEVEGVEKKVVRTRK